MTNKRNKTSRKFALVVLFAVIFLAIVAKLNADSLIDVVFATNSVTEKTGPAAIGVTSNDFWNTCTSIGGGGYLSTGTVNKLKFVDQTASDANVECQFSIPGAGNSFNGSSDPMYGPFLYDGNLITINVTGLAPGLYYVYLYGHGSQDAGNALFELETDSQSYGGLETTNGAWLSPVWQDGVQYVEFPDVTVSDGAIVIRVFPGDAGYCALSGLQISTFSGPCIVTSPVFQDLTQGTTATFSVTAAGTPPLNYQWLFDGEVISGATNGSYTVSNALSADVGNYSVVVTNFYGSVTSAAAPLSITIPRRPATLIDVAFTTASVTAKTGFAAAGLYTNDFWNACSSKINAEDSFTEGLVANLKFADRTLSGAGLVAIYYSPDEGCGTYNNGSSDPMYGPYLFDQDYASRFAIIATNLGPATYDIYLYGHGNVDDASGVFELSAGSVDYGVKTTTNGPGWLSSVWQEGVQYVKFANVFVASGDTLYIVVTPGPSQYSVLSGLQIAAVYTAEVTTLADPTNGGFVTGGGPLGIGSEGQLNAIANPGWTFAGWSDGDTENPRTITVPTNDVVYVANFVTNTAVVTLVAGPSNGGTVNGGGVFEIGSQVQISASANPGWTFTGWLDGSMQNPRTITVPTNDVVYVANFVTNTAVVTLVAGPSNGGTVNGGGVFEMGSQVQISASANPGWTFTGWLDGSMQNPRTITVPTNDVVYVADFITNTAIVTLIAAPSNGGTVNGGGVFEIGSQVQISASANPGWTFTGWLDGSMQNPRTITVPTNEVVYLADFVTNTAAVTLIAAPLNGGTVTGGGAFEIGSQIQISATADSGWTFAGWSDGSTQNPRTITVSSVGVTYAASFAFVPIVTSYSGLFYDTNGMSLQSSGFFNLALTRKGNFTAKLLLRGITYPFSGSFTEGGLASNSIALSKSDRLTVLLQLNGQDLLDGQIIDVDWVAQLLANRSVFSKTNLAPQAGKYTLLMSASVGSPAQPGGASFGSLTVDHYGNVVFSGKLCDGTSVAQSVAMSGSGRWPFYVSLYSGKGSIFGWLTFGGDSGSGIAGATTWTKMKLPAAHFYPAGFTNQAGVMGSRFEFTNGVPLLNFAAGELWLTNGGLSKGFTNEFVLNNNDKVTDTDKMSLTISPLTGRFSGAVVNPANRKQIPIYGVVLQKQNIGAGYFLDANQSGAVWLGPGP